MPGYGWLDRRDIKIVVLVVVRQEHEASSDLRRSDEVYNCGGSHLGITVYRFRNATEALVERSWIEGGRYPFPVLD